MAQLPDSKDFIEKGVGGPAYGSAVPIGEKTEKIVLVQEAGMEHCATFQLYQEDHTVGNALRYLLMRDRQVDFAGYAIPHPSKPVLHLHVQTTGTPAVDAFERSLQTFEDIGTHLLDTFRASLSKYQTENGAMDTDY